jgi:cytidyltransferase-like protein
MVVVVFTVLFGHPFHHEHVAFLRRCKQLGDVLVVGVCGDDQKANERPSNHHPTMQQRATVIEACRFVDRVVCDCPYPITRAFIHQHGIDVMVGGFDMERTPAPMLDGDVSDDVSIEVDRRPCVVHSWHSTPIRPTTVSDASCPALGDMQQNRINRMLKRLERASSVQETCG